MMKKRRVFFIMLLTWLSIAVLVSTVTAAPQAVSVNFGMLMKPGWGGGDDVNNKTQIMILRCALFNLATRRTENPLTEIVRSGDCARFPQSFMGTGEPIGNPGWPTNTVTYTGVINLFMPPPR